MAVAPHTEWFTLYTFQEGVDGVATMRGLCEYMQEAAGNHAAALGFSIGRLHDEGISWVLSRLRVSSIALPPVHTRIQVETWPVCVEGLQFRRDFIVRDENGTILARAASYWVIVSLSTRKVVRIPAFIAEVALDNARTAMDDHKCRLEDVSAEDEACVFHARLSDTDWNRHINNLRYMDWIVESVVENSVDRLHLADIELHFRAEGYKGETISVRTRREKRSATESTFFCHSLVRRKDGKELVRAHSVWR